MVRRLIVFAKEPRRGRVKTRLLSLLTPEQTVRLYKAFVLDTLDIARRVKAQERIVAFDACGGAPVFIHRAAPDFAAVRQRGRTLGERIHNAFLSRSDAKNTAIVIIGSDAPTLPPRLINRAFLMLRTADMVVGPSGDGGYYLVGLRKPCKELFRGIRWGSSGVLLSTLARAKKNKLSVVMLDEWYDVDDRYSLQVLLDDLGSQKPAVARHTRRIIRCMNLKPTTR